MEGYKTNYRVLIADDDPNVHQSLSPYFRREGYEIFSSYDGEDAVEKARSLKPDMIILDIMMPRKDGLAVCREIRREANIPVIMLSAKGEEFDKLLGLELGADDYITKPFKLGELCSRIRALLRRAGVSKSEKNTSMECGDITIDLLGSRATLKGKALDLTSAEYRLLCLLVRNANRVVTRDIILNELWDDTGNFVDDNTLSVYVRRLREKVETNPSHPEHLITIRGFGYQWKEVSI